MAFGQGAGLVKSDNPDACQALQRVATAEEDAQFRPPARADKDRHRRCQPHGAGAGDDQDRQARDQRVRQGRGGAKGQPDQRGQKGKAHHCRHEPQGDPVDQRLHRQLGGLRLLDQPLDLRQHRALPGRRDLKDQCAGAVDRAARHLFARAFADRHRLARQHTFVDEAGALTHQPVRCHPLAGPQADQIAGMKVGDGQVHIRAAGPDDAGGCGLQRGQTADRLPGAATRPRLEPAAQQDQGDDAGRRLVIDGARSFGQEGRGIGGDGGIKEGGQRPYRDQRIHFGRAAPQGGQAMGQERPARPGQDGKGQDGLQPVHRPFTDMGHQPVV